MPSILRLGQVLRGKLGTYTVSKQLQDTVWFAKNHTGKTFVVKSICDHPRVENDRDILRRFQDQTPYIRPIIDEIEDPAEPTTIVLRHLDDHLLQASIKQTLNRKEIKYVSKRVLQALSVLHKDGYVHSDIKLNNIFVNYRDSKNEIRFSNVQLGDFGSTYPQDSEWAKTGTVIGAPLWNSPEVLMETPWNTATDIWSFGTVSISLIYGGDFNIFRLEVVMSQYRYFGSFPPKYGEIINDETRQSILSLIDLVKPEMMTPFRFVTEREVNKEDKEFILKIMKMD
ncbi:kinase-like domain-containing protein [Phialemonium atrogriseum]|uniref:Kinase-like domain-containing protein n=1 Tax=Phialemonium atrogriseum TaxID=1093897 RepID=A0AAJ0FPA7_9PEZI|nr:kinase-like domain-containing protein [Phialemonium atrogriseum]KAK1767970.1 kinase-like domain-containing protein [Phialemonium atrogriseum]